jgi:formylglycine-generating enzyme required for sulfatase activity
MKHAIPDEYLWVIREFETEGDPRILLLVAKQLEAAGNLAGAATAYDRGYGLDPTNPDIRAGRTRMLDELSLEEHGLVFRYIPAGVFLMGVNFGEPDEAPLHPVWLSEFWMSETPISWTDYCRIMGWEPPPIGFPRDAAELGGERLAGFRLREANKLRLQYNEDRTTRARDWHSHAPGQAWTKGTGRTQTAQELFGAPQRDDADAPWQYDTKPMVAVSWHQAAVLGERVTTAAVRYGMPTEAQWEKAARGGLIGARHAWGDEAPTAAQCDFGRFHEFSIMPMKSLPPNGYGLCAMNGGVWEWTADWYDAKYYFESEKDDPAGPAEGKEKVLRGGSWADCAEVQTVTYRMARPFDKRQDADVLNPNTGFRLCRTTK